MGFSLEEMFRDLHNVINADEMDEGEELQELIAAVLWWHNYAIQCGQIKEQ